MKSVYNQAMLTSIKAPHSKATQVSKVPT